MQQDIDALQQEFFDNQFDRYADIYKGTHAMIKNIYAYERYLEPGIRRRVTNWCDRFNTACTVLKEITGKKHVFTPVALADQIEL